MSRAILASVLLLGVQAFAGASTVLVDLRIDPGGTFEVYLQSSLDDNYGIASYQVKLANFDTIAHTSPRLGFATNAAEEEGPAGFSLLRSGSNAATIHASQDTVGPTPHLIRGFGQTASSFSAEGLSNFGNPQIQTSWGAPLQVATGTWSGTAPTFLFAGVNVFNSSTDWGVGQANIALANGLPSIDVVRNGVSYASGDSFNFGSVPIGGSVQRTFTVKNPGSSELVLGTPTIAGPFSLTGSFPSSIPMGGMANFTVAMDASAAGSFSNTLSFGTNIAGVPSFDLQFAGEVLGVPAINVLNGATPVPDGGSVSFGTPTQGGVQQRTLTIQNSGSADLVLGSPTIGGPYSLVNAFPTSIPQGGSADVTIAMDTAATGNFTNAFSFGTNVAGTPAFDVQLTGQVLPPPAPAINVLNGATPVSDGGSVSFGNPVQGTVRQRTLTLQNPGTAELLLGTPTIGGPYSLVNTFPTSIPQGGTADVTIAMDTSATGTFSNAFSFGTNVAGTPAFDLQLTGQVVPQPAGIPAIAVMNGTTTVADGGSVSFGTPTQGTVRQRTLTIKNPGTADLFLDSPTLSGPYSLVNAFPTSIPQGGMVDVTISMDTSATGTFSNAFSFGTNVAGTPTFDMQLTGQVLPAPAPAIAVMNGTTPIPLEGTVDFGTATPGSLRQRTLTIKNPGTATLLLGSPDISGPYSLVNAFPTSIPQGGMANFTIKMNTSLEGPATGSFAFSTNVSGLSPFEFNLTGEVQPVVITPVVTVNLVIGPDGTFKVTLSDSIGDNTGIASYQVTLGNVASVVHTSPRANFAADANDVEGSAGFTLLRSPFTFTNSPANPITVTASQDTVTPTPHIIYGFGQFTSSFAANGLVFLSGGLTQTTWGAPLTIMTGTYSANTLPTLIGANVMVFTSQSGLANTAAQAMLVTTGPLPVIPEPSSIVLAGIALVGLVAYRRPRSVSR